MSRKYVFENEEQKRKQGVVYRIRALVDIPLHGVKAGDLGGFIESDKNLSHQGNAWVADEAVVMGKGGITGDVLVKDTAVVRNSTLAGHAVVEGEALVEECDIEGDSHVFSHQAIVKNCTFRGQNIQIVEEARVENVFDSGFATSVIVCGNAMIRNENAEDLILTGENISIMGNSQLINCKQVTGSDIRVTGDCLLTNGVRLSGNGLSFSDHVFVEGNIDIQNNVRLADFVHLHQKGKYGRKLYNLNLSGDLVGTPEMVMGNRA